MRPGWYRCRNYPHFDRPVSFDFADSYVRDAEKVAKHSFFPFISYIARTPRYRKEKQKVIDKERVISYAAHLDSHIFAFYSQLLVDHLESIYAGNEHGHAVLAYRSLGKSNIDFANAAFDDVVSLAPCVAKAFDVTGFFDNIDHALLKDAWTNLLGQSSLPADHYAVFKAITRFANVDRPTLYQKFDIGMERLKQGCFRICDVKDFRNLVRGTGMVQRNPDSKGIPQGSPISAVLSNLYMLDFDGRMTSLAAEHGARYRRYSDDILFICPSGTEQVIEDRLYAEIRNVCLEANPDKTDTVRFQPHAKEVIVADGQLQYLGFTFDGVHRRIRPQTLAKYYRRARCAVRAARKAADQGGSGRPIYKREIYERYTHLGKRNFLSYAYRASKKMKDKSIRRQLARHWDRIQKMLNE